MKALFYKTVEQIGPTMKFSGTARMIVTRTYILGLCIRAKSVISLGAESMTVNDKTVYVEGTIRTLKK